MAKKHVWQIGLDNLRSEYERQRVAVAARADANYTRLVETFRLVGRTSERDLELCRALARHMN